jgi:hypothetical protein
VHIGQPIVKEKERMAKSLRAGRLIDAGDLSLASSFAVDPSAGTFIIPALSTAKYIGSDAYLSFSGSCLHESCQKQA